MKTRGFELVDEYKGQGITLPERKTGRSAGYDLAAARDIVVPAGKVAIIPTGLKAYMQADEYLGIHIRSGMAIKKQLMLVNSQGIIDADYYGNPDNDGHIMVAVINMGDNEVSIAKGTRIAQGIFYQYLTADGDAGLNTVRIGGFGSTGEN